MCCPGLGEIREGDSERGRDLGEGSLRGEVLENLALAAAYPDKQARPTSGWSFEWQFESSLRHPETRLDSDARDICE